MNDAEIDELAFDIAKMTGFGWECVCQFDESMQYVCLTCRLKKYLRKKLIELELVLPEGWPRCGECEDGFLIYDLDEPFQNCNKCHVTGEAGHEADIWREAQRALMSGVNQKKNQN